MNKAAAKAYSILLHFREGTAAANRVFIKLWLDV
jgi:hypothetical protein